MYEITYCDWQNIYSLTTSVWCASIYGAREKNSYASFQRRNIRTKGSIWAIRLRIKSKSESRQIFISFDFWSSNISFKAFVQMAKVGIFISRLLYPWIKKTFFPFGGPLLENKKIMYSSLTELQDNSQLML